MLLAIPCGVEPGGALHDRCAPMWTCPRTVPVGLGSRDGLDPGVEPADQDGVAHPHDQEPALVVVGDRVAGGIPHVLVDDGLAAHGCSLAHEIVRDEQEIAATSSPLFRRKRYPPDHVESR